MMTYLVVAGAISATPGCKAGGDSLFSRAVGAGTFLSREVTSNIVDIC